MSIERLGPWPRASYTASAPTFSDLGNGLKKKILKQGRIQWFGCYPRDHDEVTLEYDAFLPDGTLFDSSSNGPVSQPYSFTVGAGSKVMLGWERVVQTMCVDEHAEVYIPSSLAHGDQGMAGVVPPNTDLIFRMRLVKWISNSADMFADQHAFSFPFVSNVALVDAPNCRLKFISYVGALQCGRVFTRKQNALFDPGEPFSDLPKEIVMSSVFNRVRVGETIRIVVSSEYGFGDQGFHDGLVDVPAGAMLVFDIRLELPVDIQDVSHDKTGAVTHQTVKYAPGGDVPKSFSQTTVNISAHRSADNKLLYSVNDLRFPTSLPEYCWALDNCVRQMNVHEV